jgi:DNA-binding protein HU-beta
MVNKTELMERISAHTGMAVKDVEKAMKGFSDVVNNVAADGKEKITWPGFLTFAPAKRAARTARNPQTGAEIQIAAKNTIKVSPGTALKAVANGETKPPILNG